MWDLLLRWCVDELKHTFGLEGCDDLVQYILSIESGEEIAEYVGDLLQGTEGKKKQFIDELLVRLQTARCPNPEGSSVSQWEDTNAEIQDMAKDSPKKSKRKGRNRRELPTVNDLEPSLDLVKTPIDLLKEQESCETSSMKKKNKFVNLYTKDGQEKLTILLPGRHCCECLAQKHCLINNCMTCGRIVCEQEGSGPCLFCGTLVCTNEEQKILQRDSNKSQKLRKKLMSDHVQQSDIAEIDILPHEEEQMKAGLEKALQHKDKLLEFDKNSVRRTQVLDDESDYYSTDCNQWLSSEEREALRRRAEELEQLRHKSRKDRKITLDFAGRKVLEDGENLNQYYNRFDEAVQAINTGTLVAISQQTDNVPQRELLNPNILQAAPQWMEVGNRVIQQKPQEQGLANEDGQGRVQLRLQDRELQEMSDGGWCLSMHQPWASLLIMGIKRVEGRSWYSAHRGRLWIAAAAKRPTPQDISHVEYQYRQLYSAELQFPRHYPTGCLLGCVNMTDCLTQEQYREQFAETSEESSSPFVFICSQPREMLIKFPIKGKHKIWKLDSQCHQSARRGLIPSPN
ncbi:hypothetical protein GJAV_G00060850 [Gymnothorax javanicus]|nr:hypothetical protein GJAV_G00060850 [Gymnothorax javanicus]